MNENGVISFEKPWKYSYPNRFPTKHYWSRQGQVIAPFWSDNDIRKTGAVHYVAYSLKNGDETSPGKILLDIVNRNVQKVSDKFTGRWLLIAHWDHVHPNPHGDDDHRGIPDSELEKVMFLSWLHFLCIAIMIIVLDQQLPGCYCDQFH